MAAGGSGGIGPAQLVLYTLVALITALLLMPALLPDCEPQVEIPKEEKPYNAIVFGATGQIGRSIVRELLTSPWCVNVTVVVRLRYKWMSPERDNHILRHWGIRESELSRVNLAVVQYEKLERWTNLLQGTHKVFSALGVSSFLRIPAWGPLQLMREIDLNYTRAAAKIVRESGTVTQFTLASSVGADPNAWADFFRAKGEVEAAVAALDFPRMSIFRPTMILHSHAVHVHQQHETYVGDWLCRFVWPRVHWILDIFGLQKFKAVPADRLARAMILNAERATPSTKALPYEWPTIPSTSPVAVKPNAKPVSRTGAVEVFDNNLILSLRL